MASLDSTLPELDYTQMILAAIEEVDSNEGITKTEISSYIESNYPDLPPAHSTLLSNALEVMRQTGQLVFANNSFSKPDPNAPPKRGRGRPPKTKSDSDSAPPPAAVAAALGSARPRGRPPGPKSDSPPQPSKASSGRPRGRPKKNPDSVTVTSAAAAAPVTGVKRGRGRPPKN